MKIRVSLSAPDYCGWGSKCPLCRRLYWPIYSSNNLHAAIVEIFALDGAYYALHYQNWSDNVYNLSPSGPKRQKDATVEWIDGNLGAKTTMKYPSVYLDGEGRRAGPCCPLPSRMQVNTKIQVPRWSHNALIPARLSYPNLSRKVAER